MSDFDSATGFRAPEPQELASLFPDYEIECLIATGGMGAVYRAVQKSLDRVVALKVLPMEFSDDAAFCESFEAEAKAMAKLNHPNLIGIYDFGEAGGMLFIVMEFISGQSLYDACHGHAVEPAEVIRLVTGISQGLAHAHEHGILHRDIKPANILLDDQLQPKIGDFGLARPMEKQIQEGEAIFGTPGYTAPEVLEPPHTVDQRADVFSLGAMLHELLTGKLPDDDRRMPSAICQCDPRLDVVVRKATHPNPALRYQTAEQIGEALQKIAATAGPRVLQTASPVASAAARRVPRPVHPLASSRKSGSGKVVLAMILLGLIAAVWVYRAELKNWMEAQKGGAAPPATEEVAPKDPSPQPPVDDHVAGDPEQERINDPGARVEPSVERPASGEDTGTVEVVPVQPVVPMPEKAPTELPKFDVDGFLNQARGIMVERCQKAVEVRQRALEDNVSDFHSEMKRGIRKNLENIWHANAEDELRAMVRRFQRNGNRLEDQGQLEERLKFKEWFKPLYALYEDQQREIDKRFMNALKERSDTYVEGLEFRIKKLREEGDVGAVELLQRERDKVSIDPDYFARLMLERLGD